MFFFLFKDTTDVQNSVFLVDNQSQLLEIDCVFLMGTKARGCHVVLNGSFGERVVQVPRDGATLRGVLQVNIDKPLGELNYSVFDWEEDGSIGTVPVPVDVMIISSSTSSTLGTYVLYTTVQLPTIIAHSLVGRQLRKTIVFWPLSTVITNHKVTTVSCMYIGSSSSPRVVILIIMVVIVTFILLSTLIFTLGMICEFKCLASEE